MSARIRWIVPLLSAALLPTEALAAPAQWQTVAVQEGRRVELDTSRLTRLKGGKTAAWSRLTLDHPVLDFESRVRYTAVQALNHYDCARGSYATRQRVYLLDGRAIKTEKVADARRVDVAPDTLDARLIETVCASQGAEASLRPDTRPRPMRAEMVSAGPVEAARGVKVADAAPAEAPPLQRPRLFEMPVIDKSKAEDPFKNAAPAVAPTVVPAPQPVAAPAPKPAAIAKPAPKLPEPALAPDLSRQQRELMLATSGPRKVAPKKKPVEPPAPPPPDYSKVHWGYAGLGAPENWAKIRPDYALCGAGKRQSPIDIRGGIKVDLEPIKFEYRRTHFRIVDNGHTVQVDVGEGSGITVMGRYWPLVQLHFHRPSEERINGKTYDMSVHLVHKDYDGSTAVVAVLLERGTEHPVIQTLWNHMPLEVGMEVMPPEAVIDLAGLLPDRRDYYTYMGSLTTPPCTEDVLWMVLKTPMQVSTQQIGIFARLYPNNARPIQPTHDRLIKGSR